MERHDLNVKNTRYLAGKTLTEAFNHAHATFARKT